MSVLIAILYFCIVCTSTHIICVIRHIYSVYLMPKTPPPFSQGHHLLNSSHIDLVYTQHLLTNSITVLWRLLTALLLPQWIKKERKRDRCRMQGKISFSLGFGHFPLNYKLCPGKVHTEIHTRTVLHVHTTNGDPKIQRNNMERFYATKW